MDRRRRMYLVAASAALLAGLPCILTMAAGPGDPIGMELPDPSVRGDSDAYQGVWHHWWVATALGQGRDPRWCDAVFHPRGVTLVYDNIGWVDCLALSPVSAASPVVAYNIGLILNSVLVAAGVYALARSLGSDRAAALVAGILAAWMPVRLAHLLQHYQIAAAGWTALALAAALRLSKGRGSGACRWALLALLACLAMLESPYHYLFLLVSAAALPLMSEAARSGRAMARVGTAVAAGGAPAAAFFLTGASSSLPPGLPAHRAVLWAGEPQALLLPSPFGLAGRLLGVPVRASWMPNAFEGILTPGLVVLALALLWVIRTRRWRVAAAAAAMLVLALGPQLKLLGRITPIPLPYRLIQMLPLGGGFRSPARFAVVGGMLLCVLAGRQLMRQRGWLRAALGLALVLEVFPLRLPAVSGHIPDVYREYSGDGPVLEIPVDQDARRTALFQTADGRPRYAFFLTRRPSWAADYVAGLDSAVSRATSAGELMGATGAGAVVYNRWLLPEPRIPLVDSTARRLFGQVPSDSVVYATEGEAR